MLLETFHNKKGMFMIRGRSIFRFLFVVLCNGAFAIAQQATTLTSTDAADGTAAPATAQPIKVTDTQTVVVTAPGAFRVEQELPATTLIQEAPGTSPIESLAALPSVDFTTSDPFGSYEWAVRISVRGFNQNQLGFTLDDVPLGDMSYGNWNGLHISRAITDENVGSIVLSQGTGSLATASTSNLGGAIQFYSLDPSDKRSLTVNQSFGSWNTARTFARYESGLLGHNTKFYLSGVYNLTQKWRGHGDRGQNYWQLNGKFVHDLGSTGVLTVYADVSDRREVDYQDDNKVWVQKLGYNWDNYGNWANAIQAAYACDGVGSYPSPVNTLSSNEDPCDAAYYAGAGLRKDQIAYVSIKQAIGDHLTFKFIGYGHHDAGRGLWFTPYEPTYSDPFTQTGFISPISLRTSEYGIDRGGFLTSLAYESGRNKLEGGVWFEGERWDLARRFYGTSLASPLHSVYDFPSNPFATQWAYVFNTEVYQIHLQDVYQLTPQMSVEAGFKTVETNTDGELSNTFKSSPGYVPGEYAQGGLESGKPILPQFGADDKLNKRDEIFGDVAYNVRSYVPGGYGFGNSPWGTTQAGLDGLKHTLHPETSWTEEAGFRSTGKRMAAEASYFHVNYQNRLLAFANGSGIQGNASTLNNVGGVTTNGVDGSVSLHLTPEWTLYNGATWNKSTYDKNVVKADGSCLYTDSNGNCIDIKGKINVDSPEGLYKNSLEYSKAGFFGSISSDYMSTRYFTYSNDGAVGGRFLAELGLGYGRERLGAFQDLKAQLNVINLLNSQYWGTIGTNGFVASDPLSVADNTLQVGAPRTILGTVSVRF